MDFEAPWTWELMVCDVRIGCPPETNSVDILLVGGIERLYSKHRWAEEGAKYSVSEEDVTITLAAHRQCRPKHYKVHAWPMKRDRGRTS